MNIYYDFNLLNNFYPASIVGTTDQINDSISSNKCKQNFNAVRGRYDI